ncbi:hypothetical protein [Methanogenium cariaci]|uniref:hypothetical protein n=1 Tax=Methanogenium cariaci TaxID=2197 RepID=UPI001FE1E7E9|nr:hypothetical protein [Methanogenium cariaci]
MTWERQCTGGAPTGNGFTQISAGEFHSLALTEDGTIVAWGGADGFCDAPTGNGFIQISAGEFNSLALTKDGTIVAWGGDDHFSQCSGAPTGDGFIQANPGNFHSLAIKVTKPPAVPEFPSLSVSLLLVAGVVGSLLLGRQIH